MFQLEKEFVNEFVFRFKKYINKPELDSYLFLSKEIPLDCIFELDEHIKNQEIFLKGDILLQDSVYLTELEKISHSSKYKYRGLVTISYLDDFFDLLNQELSEIIEEQINDFIHDNIISVFKEDNFQYYIQAQKDIFDEKYQNNIEKINSDILSYSNEISQRLSQYILNLATNIMQENIFEDIIRILEIIYNKNDIDNFIEDVKIYRLIYPKNIENKINKFFYNTLINTMRG